jgi:hypothetical protein
MDAGLPDGIDIRRDFFRVRFNLRPVAASQNEHGHLSPAKILLMQQILIRRHQHVKTGLFGERE